MSNLKIYIRKNNSISNQTFNIKEKNNNLENYLRNIIKSKTKYEMPLKKNLSYSKLISNNPKILYKTKTAKNISSINTRKNSFTLITNIYKKTSNQNISTTGSGKSSLDLNFNNNLVDSTTHCFTKHSSMKYLKISPIIKPLYNRTYFTPKTNVQTTTNIMNTKTNLYLNNIIKNTKIEESEDVPSSTNRQSQIINKIENMPIHIMNNINIINSNLINKDNKNLKEEKKIIFMKKRIPSCGKKSLSTKNNNSIKNKKGNENKVENNNFKNKGNAKLKNKLINNINYNQNEDTCNINKFNINNNFMNYYSNKLYCNKINKNKNSFNRASFKQNTAKLNLEEINKNNYFFDLKKRYEKDFSTGNINNDSNNNISNSSIYEQTKIAFKELNLEDFLLIIQKFDDIRKSIKYFNSLSSINKNHNFVSAKKIMEKSHINQIKLYDLYRFYMGSSFDGIPEKLFSSKKSKFYLHCYSIIFILSIGTLYIIFQNIILAQEKLTDIIKLINIQEKIFLLFSDMIIQKLNKKYNENIWVEKIIDVLNSKLIFNINNHIIQIKTFTLESYEIINKMLISINNLSKKNKNMNKFQEKYLFDNFGKKNMEYFSQIEINQIEEDFNENIFKAINLKNNLANISSYQRSITINNFKENTKNNDYYKKENLNKFNKVKNQNFNYPYNNQYLNQNYYTNSNNNKTNNNYIMNKVNKAKNLSIPNKSINIKSNPIQQYDIKIPDSEIVTPPVTFPFLNFHPKKKYTLIMDLDETMVNFKFTNIQKGIGKLFIRPFLESFLEVIKDYYEIISFTSATKDYADIVLDIIEKNTRKKYFDERLYREHTTQFGKKYIKDLSKIGRDLGRIIIVDNLSQCFKLNTENGILICSFYGEDENDNALIELQKILIKIYYDNCDVRKSIYKYKDEIFNKISKSKINYS